MGWEEVQSALTQAQQQINTWQTQLTTLQGDVKRYREAYQANENKASEDIKEKNAQKKALPQWENEKREAENTCKEFKEKLDVAIKDSTFYRLCQTNIEELRKLETELEQALNPEPAIKTYKAAAIYSHTNTVMEKREILSTHKSILSQVIAVQKNYQAALNARETLGRLTETQKELTTAKSLTIEEYLTAIKAKTTTFNRESEDLAHQKIKNLKQAREQRTKSLNEHAKTLAAHEKTLKAELEKLTSLKGHFAKNEIEAATKGLQEKLDLIEKTQKTLSEAKKSLDKMQIKVKTTLPMEIKPAGEVADSASILVETLNKEKDTLLFKATTATDTYNTNRTTYVNAVKSTLGELKKAIERFAKHRKGIPREILKEGAAQLSSIDKEVVGLFEDCQMLSTTKIDTLASRLADKTVDDNSGAIEKSVQSAIKVVQEYAVQKTKQARQLLAQASIDITSSVSKSQPETLETILTDLTVSLQAVEDSKVDISAQLDGAIQHIETHIKSLEQHYQRWAREYQGINVLEKRELHKRERGKLEQAKKELTRFKQMSSQDEGTMFWGGILKFFGVNEQQLPFALRELTAQQTFLKEVKQQEARLAYWDTAKEVSSRIEAVENSLNSIKNRKIALKNMPSFAIRANHVQEQLDLIKRFFSHSPTDDFRETDLMQTETQKERLLKLEEIVNTLVEDVEHYKKDKNQFRDDYVLFTTWIKDLETINTNHKQRDDAITKLKEYQTKFGQSRTSEGERTRIKTDAKRLYDTIRIICEDYERITCFITELSKLKTNPEQRNKAISELKENQTKLAKTTVLGKERVELRTRAENLYTSTTKACTSKLTGKESIVAALEKQSSECETLIKKLQTKIDVLTQTMADVLERCGNEVEIRDKISAIESVKKHLMCEKKRIDLVQTSLDSYTGNGHNSSEDTLKKNLFVSFVSDVKEEKVELRCPKTTFTFFTPESGVDSLGRCLENFNQRLSELGKKALDMEIFGEQRLDEASLKLS